MKKDTSYDDSSNTDKDATSAPTKTKGSEKKSESSSKPQKATHKDKKSLRESWRASSPLKKMEMILLSLMAVGGVGYLVAYIIVSVLQNTQTKMQHAPLVINSRPPEFLQPFICDLKKNGFHSGNMRTFVKNVGNARANNVFSLNDMMVIPERKTGNSFIDDPPIGHCSGKGTGGPIGFPLAPGIEMSPEIRQMTMSLPPLTERDFVQLYDAVCTYYSDDYGVSHGTCDTYVLFLPSSNPLDILNGSPSFVCDGIAKNGRFVLHTTGHCQK